MIFCQYSLCGDAPDAPEDHSRKVEDDTVILSNVQSGSSAVYQCNASNEFGYLMANAFVNVLGEFKHLYRWKCTIIFGYTNSCVG